MPTTHPSAAEVLRRVPLFADLSETEIKFLAERAVPRRYAPGELVFAEGDACPGLFVIESGNVRLFKSSTGGREQVLTIEKAGNSIAELPVSHARILLGDYRRPRRGFPQRHRFAQPAPRHGPQVQSSQRWPGWSRGHLAH